MQVTRKTYHKLKPIRGFGAKSMSKIEELLKKGSLQRLTMLQSSEVVQSTQAGR